jgi:late competence protein required for DNA uptake (superfamily II DNA/RNA helicase)
VGLSRCYQTAKGDSEFMMCVRCYEDTADQVAKAPDGSNAWVVYYCRHCNFSWRNTEEPEAIDPDKRDRYFQLKGVDLTSLMHPCPIPPLKTGH